MKRRHTVHPIIDPGWDQKEINHRSVPVTRHNCLSLLSICIRWCGLILVIILLVISVALYFTPSKIDPVSFEISSKEFPDFVGPLKVNDYLKRSRRLFTNEIVGPEGITADENGDIYTGLGDGRIIRINKDLSSYVTVVRTGHPPYDDCGTSALERHCGRPLGLEFHPHHHSDLYVADSSIGLLKVNVQTGDVETLLSVGTDVNGKNINMLNDLILLKNNTILITESSYKFSRAENRLEVLESRGNGRLLYYNLLDKSYGVLLDGLYFSNGICVSHSGDSVLIAEMTRARILRYYISGPKAGKTDFFAENLPGWPDNISPSSTGKYWIGIALVRSPMSDYMSRSVLTRSIMAKWPMLVDFFEYLLPKHGLVLELGPDGQLIRSLHDQGGFITHATSHILDRGNRLIIGSYFAPYIVELDLCDCDHEC